MDGDMLEGAADVGLDFPSDGGLERAVDGGLAFLTDRDIDLVRTAGFGKPQMATVNSGPGWAGWKKMKMKPERHFQVGYIHNQISIKIKAIYIYIYIRGVNVSMFFDVLL